MKKMLDIYFKLCDKNKYIDGKNQKKERGKQMKKINANKIKIENARNSFEIMVFLAVKDWKENLQQIDEGYKKGTIDQETYNQFLGSATFSWDFFFEDESLVVDINFWVGNEKITTTDDGIVSFNELIQEGRGIPYVRQLCQEIAKAKGASQFIEMTMPGQGAQYLGAQKQARSYEDWR
jgi:hypothetical protein